MSVQPPIVSTVPTNGVVLIYDFAPLFLGLVIGVCLCVLALALAMGMHDSGWFPRRKKHPSPPHLPVPALPNTA